MAGWGVQHSRGSVLSGVGCCRGGVLGLLQVDGSGVLAVFRHVWLCGGVLWLAVPRLVSCVSMVSMLFRCCSCGSVVAGGVGWLQTVQTVWSCN